MENDKNLEFRDRVFEFIGKTNTSISGIEKDLAEINSHVKDVSDATELRICKLEERLLRVENDFLVTKTKVLTWTSVAVVLLQTIFWAAKVLVEKFF